MRIRKIHVQNYKSLVDFQLENPPQFCAFVGPNASGKSNIFEALEFSNHYFQYNLSAVNLFDGIQSIFTYKIKNDEGLKILINDIIQPNLNFLVEFQTNIKFAFSIFASPDLESIIGSSSANSTESDLNFRKGYLKKEAFLNPDERKKSVESWVNRQNKYENEFEIFFDNYSRIFVGKSDLKRLNQPSNKLLIDASNLSQIIGQIFENENKRQDFIEWLRILIPEFRNIEVKKNNIDGSFHIFMYEKTHEKPFPIKLLSDGTKNILSLMAAVYQNSEPQFLCFEEPENGLHPQAIELLVDFFREKCEAEGHHIWLNTHSQTLVRCLEIDEIITVNKVHGETKARQFKKEEAFNIKMDEAWLTNALGGGVL